MVARHAATLPRARVLASPGAGHMGPLTHGRAVGDAILAHLAAASRGS